MQTRREFLLSAAALGAAGVPVRAETPAARKPNVVIIVSDDHGYGDFGCYGNPVLKTPHLDQLHEESVRLARFYVCPVCAPTRAALITGRYAYRSGVVDTFVGRAMMDPREVTLADSLRRAGYATGIFGKWHLGDSYPLRPVDRGFDESLVLKGGGLMQPSDPRVTSYFDPILWRNGEEVQTKGYCTDVITDAAIAFARAHHAQPFFTVITTNAPHVPLEVEEKYAAPYRAQGVPEDDARFYGMVANLDENVGRYLGELDRLGLREDTLVIFFTDNGAQYNRSGPRFSAGQRDQKGSVYEGGIHVPCFMRWPRGLRGGIDRKDLAAVIDIFPTILAACGAPAPEGVRLDGVNLLDTLREGAPVPARSYFTQWHRGDVPETNRNAAVVTQQYKLVNGKELYDLEHDPAEAHDIAAEHPDIVSRLRAEYEAWFKDVCATRGFAPVPITVGDPHESTTWLTAQDMRGTDNWRPGDLGVWHLDAARAGDYTFEVHWLQKASPEQGTVQLGCGDHTLEAPLAPGQSSLALGPLSLPAGPTQLTCALANKFRPDWILVRRSR